MAQSLRSSRRALLRGLGLGGLGFATTSWAQTIGRATSPNPLSSVLANVRTTVQQTGQADWSAAVGSTFTVRGEAGPSSMTLVAVNGLTSSGTRPSNLRPAALSLVFEGAGSQVPAGNRTYIFQRTDGSQLQLFVGAKFAVGSKAQLVAILN